MTAAGGEHSSPNVSRRTGTGQGRKRDDKPSAGTKKGDTAGGTLERRAARLEFADGAFSRPRVSVQADQADSGRDILTDIDVLSIDCDYRLRMFRTCLECKSGRGQAGEPYTIVWLAGFRQLMDFDRVTLVRSTVSKRGRALANRLDINVLQEGMIADRERTITTIPDRFAHLDGEFCLDAEKKTDEQLRGLPDLAYSHKYLRGEALLSQSPSILASLSSLGMAVERSGVLPEPAGTVVASHALIALLVASLQDASALDNASPAELQERLAKAITLGDPDDTYVLPLLEKADNFIRHVQDRTHKAYVSEGAEPLRMEVPSLREAVVYVPHYLEEYLDFARRLRSNSHVARNLLQTAELACFEALLDGSGWQAPGFAHLFTSEHRALLRSALRCLGLIVGGLIVEPLRRMLDLPFRPSIGQVAERGSDVRLDGTSAPRMRAQASLFDGDRQRPLDAEGKRPDEQAD